MHQSNMSSMFINTVLNGPAALCHIYLTTFAWDSINSQNSEAQCFFLLIGVLSGFSNFEVLKAYLVNGEAILQ